MRMKCLRAYKSCARSGRLNMEGVAIALPLVLILFSATACGVRKFHITPEASVPAADATAQIGADDNGNSKVGLKVEHLARPESLTPPATAYVVWIQPRGEAAQNQGVLRVNDDLEGQFTAITPYKEFELQVTAEKDPRAALPTGAVILRQQLAR